LAAHGAAHEARQLLVVGGERHVRQQLVGAVAEPHRVNVARDDERIARGRIGARHGRIQAVRQRILEKLRDVGLGKARLVARYQRLDDARVEAALRRRHARAVASGRRVRIGAEGHRRRANQTKYGVDGEAVQHVARGVAECDHRETARERAFVSVGF
jgi:hypothetical protein